MIAAAIVAAIALVFLLAKDEALRGNDIAVEPPPDSARPNKTQDASNHAADESRLDEILSRCEPYDGLVGDSEPEREAELERVRNQALRKLVESDDAEHLVAAAYLEGTDDPRRTFELLAQASAMAPKNAFVSWSRLKMCGRLDEQCEEEQSEIGELAIANDPGNAAVWANVALMRLRAGEDAEALRALEQAAAAPYLDSFIVAEAMMYDRALAAATDISSRDRFSLAWVWAISLPDGTSSFGQRCHDLAVDSIPWREACLGFHEQLFHRGKGYLQRMIALAVQAKMHEYSANHAGVKRVEAERALLQAHLDSNRLQLLDKIVVRDEAMMRTYAEVFRNKGEMAALDYVEEELLRLSADPEYDPCRTNGEE